MLQPIGPNPFLINTLPCVHLQAREACDAALTVDPSYIKARQRLGTALRGLGDFIGAREELQAVQFALTHPDPILTLELAELEEAIQKLGSAGEEAEGSPPPEVVFERRKIVIEETDSGESDDGMGEASADSASAASAGAAAASAESAGTDIAGTVPTPAESSAVNDEIGASAADVDATTAAPAFARKPTKAAPPPTRPNVPAAAKTITDFENAVKRLTPFPELLVQYVRSLEMKSYGKVFKQSLSVTVLQALLSVANLEVRKDPGFAAAMLAELPKVERFGMIVPMAMKKEGLKDMVREVVDALAVAGAQYTAGLAAARKHFRL